MKVMVLGETLRGGGGLWSLAPQGKGRAVPSGKWEGAAVPGGKRLSPGVLSHYLSSQLDSATSPLAPSPG